MPRCLSIIAILTPIFLLFTVEESVSINPPDDGRTDGNTDVNNGGDVEYPEPTQPNGIVTTALQTTESDTNVDPSAPSTTEDSLETTLDPSPESTQSSINRGPATTVGPLFETTQTNVNTHPGTTVDPSSGTTQGSVYTSPGTTTDPLSETTQIDVNTDLTDPVQASSTVITSSNPVPTSSTSTTPGYTSIAGFTLNPISAQKFGESFSVGWTMAAGTDVAVTVAYNGIPCCNAGPFTNTDGQCDCLISDANLFDPDGLVNISVIASNTVSSIPAYIELEVLKFITQVSFTMLTSYSDFGTEVDGRKSQRNLFPAEHPVKFNCSYTGRFIA